MLQLLLQLLLLAFLWLLVLSVLLLLFSGDEGDDDVDEAASWDDDGAAHGLLVGKASKEEQDVETGIVIIVYVCSDRIGIEKQKTGREEVLIETERIR